MPRKIPVHYPGAIYHVMSRGDPREDIFYDDVDRQDFLKIIEKRCYAPNHKTNDRRSHVYHYQTYLFRDVCIPALLGFIFGCYVGELDTLLAD
jgi:hypothetical protein